MDRQKDYFKAPDQRTKDDFIDVLFQKVYDLADASSEDFVVVLQPKEFGKIPPKELPYWYRFLIRRLLGRGHSAKEQ